MLNWTNRNCSLMRRISRCAASSLISGWRAKRLRPRLELIVQCKENYLNKEESKMSKVKIVVNTPTKAPKPETVGKPKTPPMAGDTYKKVKTRGTGAAIKGTTHMGV